MNRIRIVTYALIGAMAAFAIFFSVTVFANTSLRLDEAQSLFQTNRDIGGMLHLVAQDVHVPLYHTLLHFWQLIFGSDIYVARLLSLVFFVGTIIGTYYLATYAFGRRSIGLFAALLVTISPFMNWYGSEARMYTMLAFMTVVHLIFFLKAIRVGGPTLWIWWTVTAILGIYTHYFFAFVLLSEFIILLVLKKQFVTWRPLRNMVVGGTIAALSLLPWLIYVYSLGFASNTQPALAEPSAGDLFDTYAQFIFGFQVSSINTIIISLWPIAVLLAFFALQKSKKKIPLETMIFVMVAVIPVLAAFIISVTIRPFYLSRYLIVALPALFIFLAWLLSRYRRRVANIIRIGLVVIVGILFVVQVISPNTPVKEDYKEAVAYLDTKAAPTDVVVLAAPFTIYPVEYYYKGSAKLTTQPIWDRFTAGAVPAYDDKKVAQETKENVDAYQHAWLMLSYDQGYNEKLKKYYDGHYQKISEKRFSPGLVIYEYRIRYDQPLKISSS
ncbi:MAG: rane protein-like protein [Candidatus Saccharibacteria bacterium]|nr:rane protein-like protein [Candidatus Saccharibacteria bacterium]